MGYNPDGIFVRVESEQSQFWGDIYNQAEHLHSDILITAKKR